MPERGKKIFIATSGWHYAHWVGPFYPEGLGARDFLVYYARRFNTVEVNNTFYRLPNEGAVRAWCDTVGDDFVFSIKASRLITHNKKLKDPALTLPRFLECVSWFGKKAGPVLFQLPPRWRLNAGRLSEFLDALPGSGRYAFEFRDPDWFTPSVYALLEGCKAAFCIYDLDGALSPKVVTAPFVYVRLHGPDGRYRGQYTDAALDGWAREFERWDAREIYCYFDNDEAGYAASDALRLKRLVEGGRPEREKT